MFIGVRGGEEWAVVCGRSLDHFCRGLPLDFIIGIITIYLLYDSGVQGVGVMKENIWEKKGCKWLEQYITFYMIAFKKKKKVLSIFTKNYIVLITYIPPWGNKTKARNQTHTHTTTNKNSQPNKNDHHSQYGYWAHRGS